MKPEDFDVSIPYRQCLSVNDFISAKLAENEFQFLIGNVLASSCPSHGRIRVAAVSIPYRQCLSVMVDQNHWHDEQTFQFLIGNVLAQDWI